jgi:hypothetical protein
MQASRGPIGWLGKFRKSNSVPLHTVYLIITETGIGVSRPPESPERRNLAMPCNAMVVPVRTRGIANPSMGLWRATLIPTRPCMHAAAELRRLTKEQRGIASVWAGRASACASSKMWGQVAVSKGRLYSTRLLATTWMWVRVHASTAQNPHVVPLESGTHAGGRARWGDSSTCQWRHPTGILCAAYV